MINHEWMLNMKGTKGWYLYEDVLEKSPIKPFIQHSWTPICYNIVAKQLFRHEVFPWNLIVLIG